MGHRPPPPPPPKYLDQPYPSSQKGGTLIAEDVTDLATHTQRLCTPDGYRPARCPRCGHRVLHVHDYRVRQLYADPQGAEITVVRYRCAAPACGARWLRLPQLLARHLWRRWAVVETTTGEGPPAVAPPPVPARTARRWRARLQMSGQRLAQVLATSGMVVWERAAQALGLAPCRAQVVAALALSLGAAAALFHRLVAGLRLM
jgi:hypothetical protein